MPGEIPIPPPTVTPGQGLSTAAASLLTGSSSPAPVSGGEAQVGGSSSPMSDPVPPQNPPTLPGSPSGAETPPALSPDVNNPENADIVRDFWSRHGRAPTALDIQVIHAVPAIERALGRPPMRIEILQFLGARQETPLVSRPQFEPDLDAVPSGPGIGVESYVLGDAPLQPKAQAEYIAGGPNPGSGSGPGSGAGG